MSTKENNENKKDVRLLSRTSIYLSQPKKKVEEKKQPPRKHRLPAEKNDLTK